MTNRQARKSRLSGIYFVIRHSDFIRRLAFVTRHFRPSDLLQWVIGGFNLPRVVFGSVVKKAAHIRVMIVDDHPAFRKGIAALVESEPDMKVVAETGDGLEAIGLFRRTKPDVVLMDLRLPGMGGVEATMAIRKEFPNARIVVLTTFDADEDIYRAIQSRPKSCLLTDTPDDELAATL